METILPVARRVGALLKARGETVAVCESSAGGLVAASLLSVGGASAYFMGGTVVYTADARAALLGIGPAEMAGLRSSSEPYALLLARTTRKRLAVSWGIAETGAAVPSGNRYGDAAGHTCLAIVGAGDRVTTLETGNADRETNMRVFAKALLDAFETVLRSGD